MDDYIAATRSALAAAVSALLTARDLDDKVTVVQGWPDAQARQPAGAVVAIVTSDQADEEGTMPSWLRRHGTGDAAVEVYGVARWTLNAQIEVITDHKDQVGPLARVVGGCLSNPPFNAGLDLTLSTYWNTLARVRRTGMRPTDTDGPLGGRWRRTFLLSITGAVVETRAIPALAEVVPVITRSTA